MKKVMLFVAAFAVLCSCELNLFGRLVQGNGVSMDTEIKVGEFDAVSLVGSMDVYFTQSAGPQSVVLTCDENLADYFEIEVRNNTLVLSTKSGYILSTKVPTFVTVSAPALKSAKITGSGDIHIKEDLKVDGDFNCQVSGSGDLFAEGAISCLDLNSKVSGSGNINLYKVLSESSRFTVSGSGDIGVNLITSDSIIAIVNGSGDISLDCKGSGDIDARINGSGNITLCGTARSLKQKVVGSGDLNFSHLVLL